MSLDQVKNFCIVEVSTGYDDTATSIVLKTGDGSKLPDPANGEYNLVWYDDTNYKNPATDPNVEIVRVTALSTDTITITRAQEGTSATTKNTSGSTYKMVLSLTKKMIDDIESSFLKIDQTTPQTIDNGVPLLDDTPNGAVDIKSLVNKEYVDLAVTSLGAVYYMYDEDDGTGYKTCYLDPSSDSETYIDGTSLADNDYIGGWISASGEEPTKLLKGVYNWYLTAEKTTGTQELRIYWKLVERKSDDSEIVIATSSNSNVITDKGDYIVPLQLSSDYLPDSGSRIVGKLYADISGGGNAPTVRVYYQGSTSSRWEIPANSEVFKNIFVPYSGATKDVDMNTHKISGVVDPTSNQDAATKKYVDDNIKGVYSVDFDNTDLSSGILTLNHNLNNQWQVVSIYDNNYKKVIPDEVTLTSTTVATVDLSSFGTITGTWHAIVVGVGGQANGISEVKDDTTPQLGGDLDTNGHKIDGSTTDGYLVLRGDSGATDDFKLYDSGILDLPKQSGCKVKQTTDQTISSGTQAKINLDTIEIDKQNEVSLTNDRITFSKSGVYLIVVSSQWSSNSSGYRRIEVWKNGSPIAGDVRDGESAGFGVQVYSFSFIHEFSANDYIEVYVDQNTGGDLTMYEFKLSTIKLL